jgi:hypothetical protein
MTVSPHAKNPSVSFLMAIRSSLDVPPPDAQRVGHSTHALAESAGPKARWMRKSM